MSNLGTRQSSRGEARAGFGRKNSGFLDGCFVDQHDRNVIFNRVDAVAILAFQALGSLAVFEGLLARGANQDIQ